MYNTNSECNTNFQELVQNSINLLNNNWQFVLKRWQSGKHSIGQSTQGGPITYVLKGRGEPLNAGGPRRLRNDIPLG